MFWRDFSEFTERKLVFIKRKIDSKNILTFLHLIYSNFQINATTDHEFFNNIRLLYIPQQTLVGGFMSKTLMLLTDQHAAQILAF